MPGPVWRGTSRTSMPLQWPRLCTTPTKGSSCTGTPVSGPSTAGPAATTTTEANVEALDWAVQGALRLERFEAVVGGITVPEKKPDPKVYQVALEKLGLNPEEAVAIEDAKAGVTAARGAGLRCLASPSFYTIEHDLSEATTVVESLADRGDGKPVTIDYLEMLAD